MNYLAVTKKKRLLKHVDRLQYQYLQQLCTMQVSRLKGSSIIRGLAHLVRHLSTPQHNSIVKLKCMGIHKQHLLVMNRITFLKWHQEATIGTN